MARQHVFMPIDFDQWKCSCGTMRRRAGDTYEYKQGKGSWIAAEPTCGERKLKMREPSPARVDRRCRPVQS